MRTKSEIKNAVRFFNQKDWPSSIVRSVALRVTLQQSPEECNNILENTLQGSAAKHGALLVEEVRRLRRELRKQIKGNQRLSRALGLIIEHDGPVIHTPSAAKKGQKMPHPCEWRLYEGRNIASIFITGCGAYVAQDRQWGPDGGWPTCPTCSKPIKFHESQLGQIARSEEKRKTSEELRKASAEYLASLRDREES